MGMTRPSLTINLPMGLLASLSPKHKQLVASAASSLTPHTPQVCMVPSARLLYENALAEGAGGSAKGAMPQCRAAAMNRLAFQRPAHYPFLTHLRQSRFSCLFLSVFAIFHVIW